jgi:hypothetical protein
MAPPPSNREKHGSPDGLVVRGRPPFAMTPTSLLRNPSISSHAVRLWSVLASYTYGDQATDRPSRSQLASAVGWKSIRSVDTYLAELQRTGYLTVEHQWRGDRGQSRSLYILEWEPREPTPSVSGVPVDGAISAGHTPAQNPARGVIDPGAAIVNNSVSAGQTPAQDSARGVIDGSTPVQDSAGGPVQDSAHLGKERTTKKEQPPAGPLPGPGEPDGPRSTPPAMNPSDPVTGLTRVIRQNLPDRLRLQLANSTITPRAEALARAGWTETTLSSAITHRTWTGAGAGAVITWLDDLATNEPPRPPTPPDDSRSATLRRRAQHAAERLESAASEAPARQQARDLAAQFTKRARAGRPRR